MVWLVRHGCAGAVEGLWPLLHRQGWTLPGGEDGARGARRPLRKGVLRQLDRATGVLSVREGASADCVDRGDAWWG